MGRRSRPFEPLGSKVDAHRRPQVTPVAARQHRSSHHDWRRAVDVFVGEDDGNTYAEATLNDDIGNHVLGMGRAKGSIRSTPTCWRSVTRSPSGGPSPTSVTGC
jgi:hypothetical protein